MSLAYKAMSMGMPSAQVRAILLDAVTGISAAGTNQSTATVMDAANNFISTVAAGTGVRLSPNAAGGDDQYVYNGGLNPVLVYPPVGGTINNLPVNQGIIVPINTSCDFRFGTALIVAANLSG